MLMFYSEEWASHVRWTQSSGWERWDFTNSTWESIGEPKVTWQVRKDQA